MSLPIRIRARVRNGVTDVTIQMIHPMDTGLRVDDSGRAIPAHFITHVSVTLGERPVLFARMSFAVSQDPLLNFRFSGGLVGERLRVSWTDNLGEVRVDEALLA
jgi:sulfur-oxidizing protein SoxZ